MFLSDPPQDPAVGALYEETRSEHGFVMNLVRAWAWRADVHSAFMQARNVLGRETTLSKREIAVLNAATASQRNDAYCSIAWGTRLAALTDADTAAALLRGEETPRFTDRESALARWAAVVVRDPNATTSTDVEALRAARLSDREIVDATLLIAFRVAFTTVNAALGAQPDRELADQAPAEVLQSVTFGRTIGETPGPVA
ncbi:MAG: hypothetical protein JWM87_4850 [Candidatus Eremiobacteraeota bacterium]|nr:hypothetical protein [Candidatus Eremiobacteraeota bacterium]